MGKSGMQKASNQVRDLAFATLGLWQRAQIRGGLSPCSAVILVEQPRLTVRKGLLRVSLDARLVVQGQGAHRMGMQAGE
jgi:hypothetical protein